MSRLNRDEIKEIIRENIKCDRYLHKSSGGNYDCPFCGSGKGNHRTGALKWYEDTNTWYCFACGRHGDAIDLHMKECGLDFNAALEDLARELGASIDPWRTKAAEDFQDDASLSFNGKGGADKRKPPERPQKALEAAEGVAVVQEHGKGKEEATEAPQGAGKDFNDYYRACRDRLEDPRAVSYLESRGISLETARKLWIGFDPVADPASHPGDLSGKEYYHSEPRIIIPTLKSHYIGRAIDPGAALPKANPKGAKTGLFNAAALYAQEADAVFILEGAFDALSVIEAGQQAIALNSTTNAERLLKTIEKAQEGGKLTGATFIISLDNDQAGAKASQALRDGLKRLNVPYIVADICPGCKDANEALTKDRGAFVQAVNVAAEAAKDRGPFAGAVEDAIEDASRAEEDLRKRTGEGMLEDFLTTITDNEARAFEPIPTGIRDIDRALGGGFIRKTLVTLGAPPAMGKTALAQWIFENIAAAGHDVLYINLEMDRAQLLARSISRIAWSRWRKDFDALKVMRGYDWTEEERQTILEAAGRYKDTIAPHFIYNPDGVTNHIDSIMGAVMAETARIKAQGRPAPLVCLDYLQLVDSGERDAVEGLKDVIFKLKDFAKNENTVVLVIVANNRASNRTGTVEMESGRDTSAIEYSGDTMLGIAYTAIDDRRKYSIPYTDEDGKLKKETGAYNLEVIRRLKKEAYEAGKEIPAVCTEVSLKVLKSRFTDSERRANLIFDGKHSTFYQVAPKEFKEEKKDEGDGWETYTGKTPFP